MNTPQNTDNLNNIYTCEYLATLQNKLIYCKEYAPHKIGYYEALIKEWTNKKIFITSKDELKSELLKANLKISVTRCIGDNCFNLISQSYGHYTINFARGTNYESAKLFEAKFSNLTTLIDM